METLRAEIIRQHYGFAYTRFPFESMEAFRRYEREARENNRGLSRGGTQMPGGKSLLRLRVFVFEDNDALRSAISSLLEIRGYEVLSYSEPLLCPAYLNRECPCPQNHACGDVFITDNVMPNMTGLDFIESQTRHGCKAIAKNKAVMSATWTDAELERAKELDCKTFQKPFETNELLSWLAECEKRIDPNRKLAELPLREKNE